MRWAEVLARRIDQALGREPADLVIRDVRVLNTATGTIEPGAITISGDTITAVGAPREAARVIEGGGRFATPGLIDTHLHVESSLITPAEFERAVLPRGTTTAIWDPHEIANVLGTDALRWALDSAAALGMTVKVNLSSCVPATELETSGARLEAQDLLPLADHPAALGLAELMNFPGLLAKDPGLLAKLEAFRSRHVDGHAPLVRGPALDAYLACGITTDHESSQLEEAREKLAKGMIVLMREGSVTKNVRTLAPLIDERTWMRLAFCTDDRHPIEITEQGHIDHALRLAIASGAPAIPAWRAATLSAAQAFRLWDRGIVAPGRRADVLLVDDLERVAVSDVICGGRLVDEAFFTGRAMPAPVGYSSVRRRPVTAADFRMPPPAGEAHVIGIVPHAVITDHRRRTLPVRDAQAVADPARGLHKIATLERHGRNVNIGRGFVEGFGPMVGALATTIGHDSHNITVVGSSDEDMAVAVNHLIAMQGGCCAVQHGRVIAELALPVGGLMSDRPFAEVEAALRRLRQSFATLGCAPEEPFMHLAFMPLAVIPHLKLTDRGLVAATPEGLVLLDG
jgi:adenine deaminase